MNRQICEMVTNEVIAQLEDCIKNGTTLPWYKPWVGGEVDGARSHKDGRHYSFINQLMLGGEGEWITFKQAQAEGGKVKKGAKSRPVVFWKQTIVKDKDEESGEEVVKRIPILKYYRVFRVEDCEGIKAKYAEKPEDKPHANPLAEGEAVVEGYQQREGIRIYRGGLSGSAYYQPSTDEIHVPTFAQYGEGKEAEYYSTLFHEMTHSTGHHSRLNRFKEGQKIAAFGSVDYSKEELVAEMGACMLLATTGIDTEGSLRNSVAYLKSWLKALKDDVTLVVSAAGKAEKAVEYILFGKDGRKEVEVEDTAEDKTEETKADESEGEVSAPSAEAETTTEAETKEVEVKAENKSKTKKGGSNKVNHEEVYKGTVEMLRGYLIATSGNPKDAEKTLDSILNNLHEWANNKYEPIVATACNMLIKAKEGMDKSRGGKVSLPALKRFIDKNSYNEALKGVFENTTKDGKKVYCLCDGHRAVRLDEDYPSLPHVDTNKVMPLDLSKIVDECNKYSECFELPSVADIKAHIADCKAKYGKDYKLRGAIKIGEALNGTSVYVNPEFLLDFEGALPNYRIHKAEKNNGAMYVEAENGDGVILPIRVVENEETATE